MAGPRKPRTLSEQFRHPSLSIDPDLASAIETYHQGLHAAGIGGYPTDTLRELIALGLERIPEKAAARKVHNEVRCYTIARAIRFYEELIRELESAAETGTRLVTTKIEGEPSDGNRNQI
jgi:hypothetical protein